METFFNQLEKDENAQLLKVEEKWWNGNTYMPLLRYHATYHYKHIPIKINYEFRSSEFSKPSFIDQGTLGDRHIYKINCKIPSTSSLPSFDITERSLLVQLFTRKPQLNYKVYCKELKLKNMLKANLNLKQTFQLVEKSPEFSPIIEGKMKNGTYHISINFNTQIAQEEPIQFLHKFCKDVINHFYKT